MVDPFLYAVEQIAVVFVIDTSSKCSYLRKSFPVISSVLPREYFCV